MKPSTRRRMVVGLGSLAVAGSLGGCGAQGAAPGAADDAAGATATASGGAASADGSSGTASTGAGTDTSTGTGSGDSGDAGASGAAEHADGTYEATGSYQSPAGEQTIGVSVTLQDDAITAVTVTPHATNPAAKLYEKHFADGVGAVVVGKDIDDVQVGVVSGSSLTGTGFDQALATIAQQSAR